MLKPIYYKVGQKVTIYNTTLSGKVINEGEAKLSQFISKEQYEPYMEWWKVIFTADNDKTEYVRNIEPEVK